MQQHDFYEIFITPLELACLNYMVTGSIAAIFYGVPRLTHDIDVVIHLKVTDIVAFRGAFPEDDYYCPPEEIIHIELQRMLRAHFNLIHHDSGLKADIYPYSNDDELHVWAFKRIKFVTLDEGRQIRLAPPEYVIIKKLLFYHEGRSEKHLQDIKGILSSSGALIDSSFILTTLRSKGLEHLWKRVID